MAKDLIYDRPKSAVTNSTPINISFKASERPDALADLSSNTGTQGIADVQINADANEAGGADIQELFSVKLEPKISAAGIVTLEIQVSAKPGAGGDSVIVGNYAATHSETMDAWQTAAGRARQA